MPNDNDINDPSIGIHRTAAEVRVDSRPRGEVFLFCPRCGQAICGVANVCRHCGARICPSCTE